ncbi:hypothetical protein BS78_02G307300 [Paspalum vaginatum]|nr:hypothetical protein BS78_02G307300 [Paspalum vaginatum]
MVPSLKIASLVAAAVLLLVLATPQARVWALQEDDQLVMPDMVPVQTPAERVLVAIPSAAGTMAGSPICLQCRCCSKSSPSTCKVTSCCSSFNCDHSGKCNLVQNKCGCGGCGGGAN